MAVITVYGAEWCEDTRRARRHLRRLGVAHQFANVDEDLDALHRAAALNGGVRRTPTIDLGLGGQALVEPDNDTITGALLEMEMLSADEVTDRLTVQNVGDAERLARTTAGLALVASAAAVRLPVLRWTLRGAGAVLALTGMTGWCPIFHARGVTSLGGPGDRPDEASRDTWLTPVPGPPSAESGAG